MVKQECVRPQAPESLAEARQVVGAFIDGYNPVRLHGALGYVTPLCKLEGRAERVHAERDRKLAEAREERARRRAESRRLAS